VVGQISQLRHSINGKANLHGARQCRL